MTQVSRIPKNVVIRNPQSINEKDVSFTPYKRTTIALRFTPFSSLTGHTRELTSSFGQLQKAFVFVPSCTCVSIPTVSSISTSDATEGSAIDGVAAEAPTHRQPRRVACPREDRLWDGKHDGAGLARAERSGPSQKTQFVRDRRQPLR